MRIIETYDVVPGKSGYLNWKWNAIFYRLHSKKIESCAELQKCQVGVAYLPFKLYQKKKKILHVNKLIITEIFSHLITFNTLYPKK